MKDVNDQLERHHERLQRLFGEIKQLATDRGPIAIIADEAALDKTKNFFSECHHFKDALRRDSRIKDKKGVEAFVQSSSALLIAGEICNTFKHGPAHRKITRQNDSC